MVLHVNTEFGLMLPSFRESEENAELLPRRKGLGKGERLRVCMTQVVKRYAKKERFVQTAEIEKYEH